MLVSNHTSSKQPHRQFRMYVGNGNWVTLPSKTTDDLSEIFRNGVATRYEVAPGLAFDILPNDVDCNSKNTDLARLMRVDLCYDDDDDDEEKTQQALSGYVKRLLESQGTMDAFPAPPSKTNANKHQLPSVTDLPSHRHLSLVPTPPTGIASAGSGRRRSATATPLPSAASTPPPLRHALLPLAPPSSFSTNNTNNSSSSSSSSSKRKASNKLRRSIRNKQQQRGAATAATAAATTTTTTSPHANATTSEMMVDANGHQTTTATTAEALQYHYHTMNPHPLLLSRYDKDFFHTSPPGWRSNPTTTGGSPVEGEVFANGPSSDSIQLHPHTSTSVSEAVAAAAASSSWLSQQHHHHHHHHGDMAQGGQYHHHQPMTYFDKPPAYDNVMAVAAAAVGLAYAPPPHHHPSAAAESSPNSHGGEIFIPSSSGAFPFLHQPDDLQPEYLMQQQKHVPEDEHNKM